MNVPLAALGDEFASFRGVDYADAPRRRVAIVLGGYVADRATDALTVSPRPSRARRTMGKLNGGCEGRWT